MNIKVFHPIKSAGAPQTELRQDYRFRHFYFSINGLRTGINLSA